MPSPSVECVGSLVVPSSDVQELSKAGHVFVDKDQSSGTECVGSLLVQPNDLQELSNSATKPEFPDVHLPEVNLKKRVTVGTLLVDQEDLKTHDDNENSPSLGRRITKILQGPPPTDEEPDHWVD